MNPTFEILKDKGDTNPRLQMGEDVLWLDINDATNIKEVFVRVSNNLFPCIPVQTTGCLVPYDNGTIAACISAAKLNMEGSEFIIIVNYMFPGMDAYKTAMFHVTRTILDGFITTLAG